MSDNMNPELDDQLTEFTDKLLAGELSPNSEQSFSADEELRDLAEVTVRLTNAFGTAEPDPAMVQRGKKRLTAEWRKMGLAPEKVPFWRRWATALAASGRRGQQARAIALIVALIPLLVAVGVYTDGFRNLNEVITGTVGRGEGYPIGEPPAATINSGNTFMLQENGSRASISSDGRYIVYESNGNILVQNWLTHEIFTVGVGNRPAMSANGDYIVFQSSHSNGVTPPPTGSQIFIVAPPYEVATPQLVAQDDSLNNRSLASVDNNMNVAFVNDGTVYLAIPSIDGTWSLQVVDSGESPRLSDDGRWLTFEKNGGIFLYDIGGSNSAQQIATAGKRPAISHDGRYIVFETTTPLTADDTNNKSDIYLYNRGDGSLTLLNPQSNGSSWLADISPNGQYVVFSSDALNLTDDNTQGYQIYLHEWRQGSNTLVTKSISEYGSEGGSLSPSVSTNGRVAFDSTDNSLVPDDGSWMADVFVWGRPTLTMSPTTTGALGSEFELFGDFFAANSDITISANGHDLAAIPSDGYGSFEARLTTEQADPGQYFIVGSFELGQDRVILKLDPQAAVVSEDPRRPDVTVIPLPAGIALDAIIYLPIVAR